MEKYGKFKKKKIKCQEIQKTLKKTQFSFLIIVTIRHLKRS